MGKREYINKILKQNRVVKRRSDVLLRKNKNDKFVISQQNIMQNLYGRRTLNLTKKGLSRLSLKKLELLNRQQERFLESEKSTLSGRKRIQDRQFETLKSDEGGYPELTRRQFNKMLKIFDDDVIAQMRENKGFSSGQVVELAINATGNFSNLKKKVTELIKRPDYDKMSSHDIRKFLEN